jgi:hypothetical protein
MECLVSCAFCLGPRIPGPLHEAKCDPKEFQELWLSANKINHRSLQSTLMPNLSRRTQKAATTLNPDSISLLVSEFFSVQLNGQATSTYVESAQPIQDAWIVANRAARKCAVISGTSAVSLLPTGWSAVLSEAFTIWKIQAQMVSDIATLFGKKSDMTPQHLIYCLLRHGSTKAVASVLLQPSIQLMIKRLCTGFVRDLSLRLGLRISGRALGPGAALVLPAVGAIGFASVTYVDTRRVASKAIDLFSQSQAMSY